MEPDPIERVVLACPKACRCQTEAVFSQSKTTAEVSHLCLQTHVANLRLCARNAPRNLPFLTSVLSTWVPNEIRLRAQDTPTGGQLANAEGAVLTARWRVAFRGWVNQKWWRTGVLHLCALCTPF